MKTIKQFSILASVAVFLPACSTIPKNAQFSVLQQQINLDTCNTQPNSQICNKAIHSSLDYESNRLVVDESTISLLNRIYNGNKANILFLSRINDINTRADFFTVNDKYFKTTSMPVRWFGASEYISRRCVFGLGAEGCGSKTTFAIAKTLTHPKLYEWRQRVGDEILQQGFPNFRALFNQTLTNTTSSKQQPIDWDIAQLKREQAIAQPLRTYYLSKPTTFRHIATTMTQVNLLKEESRFKYGCQLMGYAKESACLSVVE